ncbi:MAG: PQQ-dependent sugar dehydrogenase [Steroidobacteraceae bacterium]|nr:PQQ-dependent sugar dehydrogenase [Deltaproteobacteria bacterium]
MEQSGLWRALCAALFSLFFAACSGAGGGSSTAQRPFPTTITLTRLAGGFSKPTSITHAGDGSGRLFVVEQGGTIRIIRNGVVAPTPFLNITSLVTPAGGEQGLLGLAFPPGFSARRSFYVNYTNRTGIGNTVVARFALTSNPDLADRASRHELLTIVQPFTNHNGGQLLFGPDNLLYIATGDGGSGGDPLGNGQNLATLLGKLLRLDVLSGAVPYAIPAGNPFGNEIWAYGLRNPWRFSFDRLTNDLFLADVGQELVEEVNFQPAGQGTGANYGWNVMEGSRCFADPACSSAGLVLPVAEYLHGNGDCSVTGGHVYRGSIPELQGVYLYGDLCSGRIWGLRRNGTVWENRLLIDTDLTISTFGEDEAGELYLADYAAGDIYRIGMP